MFELENEDQGHAVQHSQWCHLMANINLCKSHDIFAISLAVSEILMFQMCDLGNFDQGQAV